MKKKIFFSIYIFVIIGITFCLSFFMFVDKQDSHYEVKSNIPQIIENGEINKNLSADVENYVSQNFGFRQNLMDIYTSIQINIFKKSSISQVVVGENGYLYFGDTVNDYLGLTKLTKREIFQITHTLELIQEYVEKNNGEFLLLIAPNKNSLYDYMPVNYLKINSENLVKNFLTTLENINYIDLFDVFLAQEKELYYKTDTHWNNEGACLVYDKVLSQLDKQHDDFSKYPKKTDTNMKGDLYNMLYPLRNQNEKVITYDKPKEYKYLTKTRNHEQAYIETQNNKAKNSLVMFRDSFANNLIDFFSDAYQYAIYDKNSSYKLELIDKYNADTVIIEIAERNFKHIQENYPVFLAPRRLMPKGKINEIKISSQVSTKLEDGYLTYQGIIKEEYLDEESKIYLKADQTIYEMTPQMIDEKYGFYGCIPHNDYKEIDILVETSECIYEEKIN